MVKLTYRALGAPVTVPVSTLAPSLAVKVLLEVKATVEVAVPQVAVLLSLAPSVTFTTIDVPPQTEQVMCVTV